MALLEERDPKGADEALDDRGTEQVRDEHRRDGRVQAVRAVERHAVASVKRSGWMPSSMPTSERGDGDPDVRADPGRDDPPVREERRAAAISRYAP